MRSLGEKKFHFLMKSRPEAGAGNGKSGSSSRAANGFRKFIWPPKLFPNNWLPVTAFRGCWRLLRSVGLRVSADVEDGELGVVVDQVEDGGGRRKGSRSRSTSKRSFEI